MPSYDEDLLGSTPHVTKAQLQSGYATDLLTEKEPPTPTAAAVDPEAAVATTANRVSPVQRQETDSLTKKPFYATTKGRIIIAIAVVVIFIVAVVGGVVGSKKKARAKSVDNGDGSPQEIGSSNSTPVTPSGTTSLDGQGLRPSVNTAPLFTPLSSTPSSPTPSSPTPSSPTPSSPTPSSPTPPPGPPPTPPPGPPPTPPPTPPPGPPPTPPPGPPPTPPSPTSTSG